MLSTLRWLALETWFGDRARAFYADALGLPVAGTDAGDVAVDAGETTLLLREPGPVPRGGLHVHYAFAVPDAAYAAWDDALAARETYEHDFGSARSLYVYDPDDHCVEFMTVGDGDASGTVVERVCEVVLEVEDLARAESFYRALGFDPVGRSDGRPRVRLRGPIDLELWEPHRGLADARGGVHVDLGFSAADPAAVADAVADDAPAVNRLEDGVRVRDPDGHYLTVSPGT